MFRLMSFYGNEEIKFRKIGDFVFDSECSSGLLPGVVNSNESGPVVVISRAVYRGLPIVPVRWHRIGRMIWKKTNLCERWRNCSSPRKSAPVWWRAKILAALAKRFADLGLQKNGPDRKSFLVMRINPGMKAGGESPGTISRNYEGVGNPSVYLYFNRLFRPALRSHCLEF
jgi:hypothetical protein